MFPALLGLLGIGKSYVEGRQRLALKEAEAESDARLQRLSNASSWQAIVAQRSSRFLRWVCAGHLFLGMDFTIYLALKGDPNPGIIFEAFSIIPDWYTGLLATMFAWAFASEPIQSAGGKLVSVWADRKSKGNSDAKSS